MSANANLNPDAPLTSDAAKELMSRLSVLEGSVASGRRMENHGPAPIRQLPQFTWLYSCYPFAFRIPATHFDIQFPAITKGKQYTRTKVHDYVEQVYQGMNDYNPLNLMPTYRHTPMTTTGADIARDLVDRLGDRFGLFVVDGNEEPKPEQVTTAKRVMLRKLSSIVMMAQDDWEANHKRGRITDEAKQAARFLGAKVEWVEAAVGVDLNDIMSRPTGDIMPAATAAK